MLPSHLGYVRSFTTRTWHLVQAPCSSVRPDRDLPPTMAALCGRPAPGGERGWRLVCGWADPARVCKRCLKTALKAQGARR
jgi:hypothetical protein